MTEPTTPDDGGHFDIDEYLQPLLSLDLTLQGVAERTQHGTGSDAV